MPEFAGPPFLGKFRGQVVNNADPMQQGRLQAMVPDVFGAAASGWAMPCAPYVGQHAGLYAIPAIGANVWVEFERGDPSYPIWTGGWWSPEELPLDTKGKAPTPDLKILKTSAGMTLMFNDSKATLTLSDAEGSDAEGRNQIVIDLHRGAVTLKGTTRVVLEAPLILEESASSAHPAVLGDQLYAYLTQLVAGFNAHVHPGPTPAPPVPPFAPPPPGLLSLKVMLQ